MKTATLALTLALCATPVLADPFAEALDAAGGSLCFQQVEARPERQQWKAVRLSYVRDAEGLTRLRLRLDGLGKPFLIHGSCGWLQEINRGGGGRILDPTFLPTSGVTCFMDSGLPDEEAGSFPTDWADGQTLQVHLPSTVTAWRGWDTRREATWPDVNEQDRIVRVTRAPAETCAELNAKFKPQT